MNNQVAAPCCGSCEHDKGATQGCTRYYCIRYPGNDWESQNVQDFYSSRNPIPIIDIPGVKELVEKAYKAGLIEGVDGERDNIYASITIGELADRYIKALEDKDE